MIEGGAIQFFRRSQYSMLPELIEIITTTAEKAEAQAIASLLVQRRLAACAQIIGPIESHYWWNDRIEVAREWKVQAKTQGKHFAAAEQAILEVHPYDEPEILAIPIVEVSAGYQGWLLAQLAIPIKNPNPVFDTGELKLSAAAEPTKPIA